MIRWRSAPGPVSPLVCASCGSDLERAQPGRCGSCGADLAGVVWTKAPGSKPERHDFVDEVLGLRGHVTLRRQKIDEGAGERRSLHRVRASDIPDAARAWRSSRAIPCSPDAEMAPDDDEIATGAFVCGVIGLIARGIVEAALDTRAGWVRHGPFVLQTEAPGARPWLRGAVRDAAGAPRLEAALLEALQAATEAQGYRSWGPGWTALSDLMGALPTRGEILRATRLAPMVGERVMEDLEDRCPRLVSALVSTASALRR